MNQIDALMLIITVLFALVLCLSVVLLYIYQQLKRANAKLEAEQEIRSFTRADGILYSSILDAICGQYGLSTYALVSLEYIYHAGEQPQVRFTKSK